MRYRLVLLAFAVMLGAAADPNASPVGQYVPVDGGFHIRISGDIPGTATADASEMGVTQDNPRLHRRPLFPPAERALLWTPEQLDKIQRHTFRPLVLAYNEPRFILDGHAAGGILGHLMVGLTSGDQGKWFHQWSDIDVRYVNGTMGYEIMDPAFPNVTVRIEAASLADAVGVILSVAVGGAPDDAQLIWAYGAASAFFTNYSMSDPAFAYAPEQCAKNYLQVRDGRFELRRPFGDQDVYTKDVISVVNELPEWEANILGGDSWGGRVGFGDPAGVLAGPHALAATAEWISDEESGQNEGRVVVASIPVNDLQATGYIVAGMGHRMPEILNDPASAWTTALDRNRAISRRLVLNTPDPYLDAAATMMAFATEGIWGDAAVTHGGWSWRTGYLGWRGWYGPTSLGWTDRIKTSIQNHVRLNRVESGDDAGAVGSMIENQPGVYYNMNEVFLDHVRQYFDYTNDLDLMRDIFPVLVGIVEWEGRRLQPGNADLYENSLNTWISDSHWYIRGQCTQASAYMLRAHEFLAELAGRLERDPAPFREKADRIRAALQDTLWIEEKGVFAEYVDTRGKNMLHPEPELPTIYHAAEFGAASSAQIARMLDWVEGNLRIEPTPGGGKHYWSSNWYPNRGRTYTHSTYELAYAESLNLAVAQYLAGRADDAYAILRATLCGIFNGPTPGGLTCHALTDGRQRYNDEFADAISMWDRVVVEGLFGIQPKLQDGLIHLVPQMPSAWPEASIRTPLFGYAIQREHGAVSIQWEAPSATVVRLRLPLYAAHIEEATVSGAPAKYEVEKGERGLKWLSLQTPRAQSGNIRVVYSPASVPPRAAPAPARSDYPKPEPWKAPDAGDHDLSRWTLVDLSAVFNASVPEVPERVEAAAVPPEPPASEVGFGYWRSHLRGYHGAAAEPLSDAAWRAKIGPDGVGWTTEGIPFKSAKDGANIGVVTLVGGFPESLEFPVESAGTTLYLMLSGVTFPSQSHVPNLRVVLHYGDGTDDSIDLINPFTIGDCWGTWCGRYHDTVANGFENIGGRRGSAGSAGLDLSQPIEVDTEAHLVPIPLRPEVLKSVRLEAMANDIVFGVMGASIVKR